MDDDVDFSGWELPPLEDDPDREPPPERESWGGVSIGSDLVGLRFAGGGVLDLGNYVCNDLASVRPTVVGLADLGSTDFGSLSQRERVDALLVVEQHRAWLDGLQQQLLAEVSLGDTSKDRWVKEEVSAALGLAPVTAGTKLKNAEQLCTRLPATLGLLLDGRISEVQARAVTEASYVLSDQLLPAFEERVLKRAPEQTLAAVEGRGETRPAPPRPRQRGTADTARPGGPVGAARRRRGRHGLAHRTPPGRAGGGVHAAGRRGRPDGTHRGRTHPRTSARGHPGRRGPRRPRG